MSSEKNSVSPMDTEKTDTPLLGEDRSTWEEPIDMPTFDLHNHVKEDYLEVFQEPPNYKNNLIGKYLGDIFIKKFFKYIFDYTQAGVYYGLSLVIGFFASFFWAIAFALNQVLMVWVIQPWLKIWYTWLRVISMLIRILVRMVCDPFWQGIGQVFSFVRGRFRLDLKGLPIRFDDSQTGLTQM